MGFGGFQVEIDFPVAGGAYVPNVTWLNYSVGIDGNECWYSLDGGSSNSSSVVAGQNFSVSFGAGSYNVTVFCNDTFGMVANDTVDFVVGAFDTAFFDGKLHASDAAINDSFGSAVAFFDPYAFIGAPNVDAGGTDAGAVYVYRRNASGSFEQIQKLNASDAAAGDSFGATVSAYGDFLVVGAPGDDTVAGADVGSVYVFQRNASGLYAEVQRLNASDADASDAFGNAVAISGSYLLVGAYHEATRGVQAGAVYLFRLNDSSLFDQVQKVAPSGLDLYDIFGYSVALSGTFAVVGAEGDDDGGNYAGAAYVYWINGSGELEQKAKLVATDAAANDAFGHVVAVSDAYVLVGAYHEDAHGSQAGAAYIFRGDASGTYSQVQKLAPSSLAAFDIFGQSVALTGDFAVVGAEGDDTAGDYAGAAYVFRRNDATGQFERVDRLFASDATGGDAFGHAVALFGRQVLVGADRKNESGSAYGASYLYTLSYNLSVTIDSPEWWGTYRSTVRWINYSVTDGDMCWYSLDGGSSNSSSVVAGQNFSVSFGAGSYNVTVFCNDSFGEVASASVGFVVGDYDSSVFVNKGEVSSGDTGDHAGGWVRVFGDTALVCADQDDHGGFSDAGSVTVFQRGASGFSQLQTLVASDPQSNAYFGYSADIFGDTLVVGASMANTAIVTTGAAYVFRRSTPTGTFSFVQKLNASDAATADEFGSVLALWNGTLAVGAPRADPGGMSSAGAVYVFRPDASGDFVELQKLNASDAADNDDFGNSVALFDDYLVVGAYTADVGGLGNAGAVYVFHRNASGAFEELQKLNASDAAANDRFGNYVDVFDDTIVVGASYADVGGLGDAGAVYVFHRNASGAFEELQKLNASDAAASDRFGSTLGLSADYLVVGAYQDDFDGLSNAGSAYVYRREPSGKFSFVKKLTASDAADGDGFGWDVAISGDVLVSGAISDDLGKTKTDAGSAYFYQLSSLPDVTTIFPVEGGAYVPNVTWLNYSVTSGEACWYSLDGGVSNSSAVVAGVNFSVSFDTGAYNVTVFCNNSFGEVANDTVGFVVGNYNTFREESNSSEHAEEGSAMSQGDTLVLLRNRLLLGQSRRGVGGQVLVLTENASGGLTLLQNLTPTGTASFFGTSLSAFGDLLVVGSPFTQTNTTRGSLTLFHRSATGDYALFQVLNVTGATNNGMGTHVAVFDDVIAAQNDDYATTKGVHIFLRNTTGEYVWAQFIPLNFPPRSLALSDGDLFIGFSDQSLVSIYRQNASGAFTLLQNLSGPASSYFGWSLSAKGTGLAVGAPHAIQGASAVGKLYFYRKRLSTGHYVIEDDMVGVLDGSPEFNKRYLGYAVSLGGGYLAAGDNGGAVYLWRWDNTTGEWLFIKREDYSTSGANSVPGLFDDRLAFSTSSGTHLYNLTADYTPPSVELISPQNATASANQSRMFRFNASDASLANATLHVWNASADLVGTNMTVMSGTFGEASLGLGGFADGVYTWNVRVKDDVGNAGWAAKNWTFTVDTTPPTITIVSPLNGSSYSNATILVNISSDGVATWYNWNGSNETYTAPLNITFVDGTNVLQVWSNDSVGNQNSTNATFFIDTVPPYFTSIPANATMKFGETLGVDFDANDSTTFGSYAVNDSTFTISSSGWLSNSSLLTVGEHLVTVIINDSVGNTNSTSYKVTVTKGDADLDLLVDGSRGSAVVSRGETVPVNCTLLVGDASTVLKLFVDGTLTAQGVSPLEKDVTFSSAGTSTVTCTYQESENYTSTSTSMTVDVVSPSSSSSSRGSCSSAIGLCEPTGDDACTVDFRSCTSLQSVTLQSDDPAALEDIRLGVELVTPGLLPSAAKESGGVVYHYETIWIARGETVPLPATVHFRVSTGWLHRNGLDEDEVVLRRWNGDSWVPLHTSTIGERFGYVYFSADVPGLGFFAISKAPLSELSAMNETINETAESPDETVLSSGHGERSRTARSHQTGNAPTLAVNVSVPEQPPEEQAVQESVTQPMHKWFFSTVQPALLPLLFLLLLLLLLLLRRRRSSDKHSGVPRRHARRRRRI